jgi:hypothetical protein
MADGNGNGNGALAGMVKYGLAVVAILAPSFGFFMKLSGDVAAINEHVAANDRAVEIAREDRKAADDILNQRLASSDEREIKNAALLGSISTEVQRLEQLDARLLILEQHNREDGVHPPH